MQNLIVRRQVSSSQAVHKSLLLKQQIPPLTAAAPRKCQSKHQRKIVIAIINTGSVESVRAIVVGSAHGQRYVRTK